MTVSKRQGTKSYKGALSRIFKDNIVYKNKEAQIRQNLRID